MKKHTVTCTVIITALSVALGGCEDKVREYKWNPTTSECTYQGSTGTPQLVPPGHCALG